MKYLPLTFIILYLFSLEIKAQNFILSSNGVTITCSNASVGETGDINGVTYTKRTRDQIATDNASTTCTSGITDMSNLFDAAGDESYSTFNEDVSHWDVSSVTNMKSMFHLAKIFNQDLSKWDVSSVVDMSGMFSSAEKFNQDLSEWNVSNVTDMSLMFSNANDFNSPLDTWDVSKVTSMHNMFGSHFNQPIGSWDVSSVNDMSGMFQGSKFNKDISGWDVSSVTDMNHMFAYNGSYNQPLNNWDVSNVTNMGSMFAYANNFNQPLNDWDVSNVRQMNAMFIDNYFFNQPLDAWDVSSVTQMNAMFANASEFDQDISGWDVSSVEQMDEMFNNAVSFNQPLNDWDVSNVTNMHSMFSGYAGSSFNQPLNHWNTSNVTDMSLMFFQASKFNQDLSDWDVSKTSTMKEMFISSGLDINNYSNILKSWSDQNVVQNVEFGVGETQYYPDFQVYRDKLTDTYNWDIADGGVGSYFTLHENGITVVCINANIGDSAEINGVTYTKRSRDQITSDNASMTCTSGITDMSNLFESDTTFNSNINHWDVSSVTNMTYMFAYAENYNQPLNDWDVSNVTTMEMMFSDNYHFNQPLDKWNVSRVTSMHGMFNSASSFNQDISNWDVSSVEDMAVMFTNAVTYNQPLNDWDVSNVSSMREMFAGYVGSSFNQELNNWNTSKVTDMSWMFYGAKHFNQPINDWDVSNVTSMRSMFMDAISFSQPLDAWDVSEVREFNEMFRRSNYNGDIEDWNVSKGTDFAFTFYNNKNFNRDLSKWNIEKAEGIDYMFTNTAIDEINYSKILIGWSQQNVKDSLVIEVHDVGYLTEAESYRNKLIDDHGWSIKDAGKLSNGIISVSDVSNKQGFNSIVTISLSEVKILNDLYSVQFDIHYPKFVEFVGIDTNNVSSNYTFEINNLDSLARVAIVSDSIIPTNVNLLNVIVQSNQIADSSFNGSITIKNGLFNTYKADSSKSGKVSFTPLLIGDVDDSGDINAYDAAIVLNKSIGVDILDEYINIPWEEWRSYSSDIDKDGQILAIDATYILQKVVGLIDDFPKSTQPVESVIIEVTNRGLKVIAPEEIQSLNVSIQKKDGFRIKDLINYWENSTIANYSNGTFDLAIASSGSITGEILEIPMDVYTSDDITFEVITFSNNTKQVHSIVVNSSTVNNESEEIRPNKFTLDQNYPNPFNPSTQIQYALPEATEVTLEVFNSVGQKVMELVNGQKSAGYHTATFDASGLSSGVYLYKLTTPSFTQTKKMLLIK